MNLSQRTFAPALLFISTAPLVAALLAQYGFGFHPCELCLWQRVPLVVLMLLVLLAWRMPRLLAPIFILSAALWIIEAGLAAYHVGVEQQWWQSATGCSSSGGAGSLDALRAQIMSAPLVSCDVPELVLLGVSMAGWNIVYSLACLGFICALYSQHRKAL